jgi:hypothetical protein
MSRRKSRKKRSPWGTLLLEFSTLAGMLGVTQPALRDQFWDVVTDSARVATNAVGGGPSPMPSYASSHEQAVAANPSIPSTTYAAQLVPLPTPVQTHWSSTAWNQPPSVEASPYSVPSGYTQIPPSYKQWNAPPIYGGHRY